MVKRDLDWRAYYTVGKYLLIHQHVSNVMRLTHFEQKKLTLE